MCIQNPVINIQEHVELQISLHLIAPTFTFTCNGRVTGVTAHLAPAEPLGITPSTELPVFQVWHPVLPGSSVYSIVGQVQFQSAVQINGDYSISTVLLTEDDQIKFQSGDLIASYHPPNPSHYMRYIDRFEEANYTAYGSFNTNLTTATIDISGNGTDYFTSNLQPLFNITTVK